MYFFERLIVQNSVRNKKQITDCLLETSVLPSIQTFKQPNYFTILLCRINNFVYSHAGQQRHLPLFICFPIQFLQFFCLVFFHMYIRFCTVLCAGLQLLFFKSFSYYIQLQNTSSWLSSKPGQLSGGLITEDLKTSK